MARVRVPITVIDPAGNSVSGASVRVQKRVGGADAVLYTSETGPSTTANPTTTDAYGRTNAWVDRGQYNAIVSGGTITTYTQPFDAASGQDFDISDSKAGVGGWATGTFSAHLGAAWGTSGAYAGAIQFGVVEFDTSGWYLPASGRFTPQIAGIYRVGLALSADAIVGSAIYVGAGLFKNGSIIRQSVGSAPAAWGAAAFVESLVQMNGTTDYLDGRVYGGSASAGAPQLAGTVHNAFFGELVGRA